MQVSKYKIGDNVIGVNYPDNIPAKVIEVIKTEIDLPLVKIEYLHNNILKAAILHEYRIKKIQ